MIVISFLLATLAIILAIPVFVFFLEVLASCLWPRWDSPENPSVVVRPRIAVVVPAHNESTGLIATIEDIKAQIRSSDRLLVVADNCTDDTAAVALAGGAEVVERNDPEKRGKGYALARGLHHLSAAPPEVVIFIDADCRLSDNAVDQLATVSASTRRPVQALDVMIATTGSPVDSQVAQFAWWVKNFVRPLGLRAVGLPCQLMGTGIAFPWDVICSVNIASGSIVEDLKLGIDLARVGHFPLFCPSARVTSEFPISPTSIQVQRLRWEQGHLMTIMATAPSLIFASLVRANFNLLAMALDVAVPPLSLLAILTMGMLIISSSATLFGFSTVAMLISTGSLIALVSAIFVAWFNFGRQILSASAIRMVPSYLIGKLPIYRKIIAHRSGLRWTRTDRRKR